MSTVVPLAQCPAWAALQAHHPASRRATGTRDVVAQQAPGTLGAGQQVMLKLTLPSRDDFHAEPVGDLRVRKVVARSGGYSRSDGNALLARNHGVIASLSRALVEGLSAGQSCEAFDGELDEAIQGIYEASLTRPLFKE